MSGWAGGARGCGPATSPMATSTSMPTTGAERPVEPPHLETERLILRRPVPGDAPAIQRLAGEWEVARYTARIPHPYPEGAAERWIAALADEDDMVFAVERRDDGAFLGCCG